MTRILIACLFCCCVSVGYAQVRFSKLVIQPHQTYVLDSTDILVADSLIMMDSSTIRLNVLKPENVLRAQVAVFGKHCRIEGRGVNGGKGSDGAHGTSPIGPCRNGTPGRNGLRGLAGGPGTNLFFYVDKIHVTGRLYIDLTGGNGGDGGDGGDGGGGGPGTRHCNGGDGGDGGNGGQGGDGGRGGILTIGGGDAIVTEAMVGSLIVVRNAGGSFGYGGLRGAGGPPGLGPQRKHGRNGQHGTDGGYGEPGSRGAVTLDKQ